MLFKNYLSNTEILFMWSNKNFDGFFDGFKISVLEKIFIEH